jgi:hypothetical protein
VKPHDHMVGPCTCEGDSDVFAFLIFWVLGCQRAERAEGDQKMKVE